MSLRLAVKRAGIRLLHFFEPPEYNDLGEFVARHRDEGFLGKWTKDEERTLRNETRIVRRVRESFEFMKVRQRHVAETYLPAHEWKRITDNVWSGFREMVERRADEEIGVFFRNFFRNEGIAGLWGGSDMYQTFVDQPRAGDIARARAMLLQFQAWRQEVPDAEISELDALRIGNPWGYDFEGFLLYEPVFEYDFQSRYFMRILRNVSHPIILEIGGGFGGLASFIMRRGRPVKYIGIDLPENLAVQGYYLSSAFPDLKIYLYDSSFAGLSDEILAEHDIILLPNFELPNVSPSAVDLVANVRSLSEMGWETIAEYLRQIDRIGSIFFFHENIFKPRKDDLHGIPSSDFPELQDYTLITSNISRWPRYDRRSGYACRENLYVRSDRISRT